MEETSSVEAAPKPQSEAGAPQSPPDSEAGYQRRAAFLGNPRTKWGLIIAGLVLLVAIFQLPEYGGHHQV